MVGNLQEDLDPIIFVKVMQSFLFSSFPSLNSSHLLAVMHQEFLQVYFLFLEFFFSRKKGQVIGSSSFDARQNRRPWEQIQDGNNIFGKQVNKYTTFSFSSNHFVCLHTENNPSTWDWDAGIWQLLTFFEQHLTNFTNSS